MAILLKCSKCREQLEVDDAFAGGVCRCVHCGALSQVPLQPTMLDCKGRPTSPPQMALPVVTPPEEQHTLQIAPTRRYAAQTRRLGILAVILMLASLAMIALMIMLLMNYFRGEQPASTSGSKDGQTSGPTPSPQPEVRNPIREPGGPSFLGLAIPQGNLAFLLNVGNSMRDVLDPASVAIEGSVKRLGERQYAVVPWRTGNADITNPAAPFPESALAKADRQATGLADWFAHMDTLTVRDAAGSAGEAIARGAAVLLVVTCNDLTKDEVDALLAKAQGKNVTWLAVAIHPQPGEMSNYPELVRLTGDAGRVKLAPSADVQTWLSELQNSQ